MQAYRAQLALNPDHYKMHEGLQAAMGLRVRGGGAVQAVHEIQQYMKYRRPLARGEDWDGNSGFCSPSPPHPLSHPLSLSSPPVFPSPQAAPGAGQAPLSESQRSALADAYKKMQEQVRGVFESVNLLMCGGQCEGWTMQDQVLTRPGSLRYAYGIYLVLCGSHCFGDATFPPLITAVSPSTLV